VLKREKNIYNILEGILFEREILLFLFTLSYSLSFMSTYTLEGALDMRKRKRGIYYYYYSGAHSKSGGRKEGLSIIIIVTL
jgi:hypothetical protein